MNHPKNFKHNSFPEKVIIYTDGGSRGNPGPAAFGVVIKGWGEARRYQETLGRATNNQAEYQGVIFALKKVKLLLGKTRAKQMAVEVRTDSELLTKQLNGEYKVLDENIQPLFLEIWNLKLDFQGVIFKHIFREENREADQLVNAALDEEKSRLF